MMHRTDNALLYYLSWNKCISKQPEREEGREAESKEERKREQELIW